MHSFAMCHIPNLSRTLILSVVCAGLLPNAAIPDTSYTDNLRKRFTGEYRYCHVDSVDSAISFDSVLAWKKKINNWALSEEYPEYVQRYLNAHPQQSADEVLSCEVYRWARRKEQQHYRDSVQRARYRRDSLQIAQARTKVTPSRYDFGRIPFGLTRKVVQLIFSHERNDTLQVNFSELIKDTVVAGAECTIKFFFNRKDFLYSYSFQSNAWPADSLDTRVRDIAHKWTKLFSKRFNASPGIHRIGFIDIGTDSTAVYRTWGDSCHQAAIGFIQRSHRFAVTATVEDTCMHR